MKYLKTTGFLMVLFTYVQTIAAQKVSQEKIVAPRQISVEKPALFKSFPEKLTVNKLKLDQVFSAGVNRISLPLDNGISFEGTILEKVQKNPNVVSVNIRLHDYDSSLLNISRITQSDLSVTYIARIVNIKSGDILLLNKENGQFFFTKEKQSLVIVE